MTEQAAPPAPRRSRLPLVLVIALFLAPMLLAWLFSAGVGGWRPADTVVRGELLRPSLDTGTLALQGPAGAPADLRRPFGQFTLLLLGNGPCGPECLERADLQRRLWLLLGHETRRVRLVVLSDTELSLPPPSSEAPVPLEVLRGDSAGISRLRANQPGYELYVADYRGHLILRYPPDRPPTGVLKDLKRVLRASNT